MKEGLLTKTFGSNEPPYAALRSAKRDDLLSFALLEIRRVSWRSVYDWIFLTRIFLCILLGQPVDISWEVFPPSYFSPCPESNEY